jgi:hypothetical protein
MTKSTNYNEHAQQPEGFGRMGRLFVCFTHFSVYLSFFSTLLIFADFFTKA